MNSHSVTARRISLLSMGVSAALAALKLSVGWLAGSTAVMADGAEAAGDVVSSAVVYFGLALAAMPPDENHPYGHGRLEILSGFTVGVMLALAGAGIAITSMQRLYVVATPPKGFAVYAMIVSVAAKSILSAVKFHYAKRTGSDGLRADAWNDAVDILSGVVALGALSLTLLNPARFLAADSIGGIVVGLLVIFLGLMVVRDSSLQLMDTMPGEAMLSEVRRVALLVPGALGVEKCFARKTGLQYHVDLHLEVDPELTVRQSHDIATQVRKRLQADLEWVADVLVHVEPHGMQ
ncbi:MAG: cation transporter [Bryobacterales bacterium]|nr:cation transporter [Bryobacterales bacterium]